MKNGTCEVLGMSYDSKRHHFISFPKITRISGFRITLFSITGTKIAHESWLYLKITFFPHSHEIFLFSECLEMCFNTAVRFKSSRIRVVFTALFHTVLFKFEYIFLQHIHGSKKLACHLIFNDFFLFRGSLNFEEFKQK